MTDKHPITPPPELVKQWCHDSDKWTDFENVLSIRAAQWGADQELEACAEWLQDPLETAKLLRATRRPEPPSLKEQALDALREAESTGCLYVNGRSDLIRKALEALPND